MRNAEDCLRAALEAVRRGDYAERDRQIALARNCVNAAERMKASGDIADLTVGEAIVLPDRSNEPVQ